MDEIKDTLDTIEETLDIIEKHRDLLIPVAVGCTVVGLAVGGLVGYKVAVKRLNTKYDELARQEIAEARALYNRLTKEQMQDVKQDGGSEVSTPEVREAADALLRYQGKGTPEKEEEDTEPDVTVEVNVFTRDGSDHEWDQDKEDALRVQLEDGVPYVISEAEWTTSEMDYQQAQLTYYEGDNVLADDQDKDIPDVESVIGAVNLERFGHGTDSTSVVFIRNDKLGIDFEVLKHEGKYAQEVLGFQHSDYPMRHPNRRRVADEE